MVNKGPLFKRLLETKLYRDSSSGMASSSVIPCLLLSAGGPPALGGLRCLPSFPMGPRPTLPWSIESLLRGGSGP
jgi:hypothetical protein